MSRRPSAPRCASSTTTTPSTSGRECSTRIRRGVRAQLARRDAFTEADLFEVAFDSYHDHNTAFVFGVNPSGVKTDRVVGNDGFSVGRRLGSGVGRRRPASIPRAGRSSCAFRSRSCAISTANSAGLGRQLLSPHSPQGRDGRVRVLASERSRLFVVLRSSRAGSSGSRTRGGSSSLPYATMRQERIDPARQRQPVQRRVATGRRRRASTRSTDSRPSLTLDATINPDFGQVDADPAFVNLSAFEQFLNERRPFFVEGADIFNFNSNNQLFYSRRIGRPPQGSADPRDGFVDQPDHATIVGAGKLSGRVGGWSFGVLEATTAREHATVDSAGPSVPRRRRAADELSRRARPARLARRRRPARLHRDGGEPQASARRRSTSSARSAYVGGVDFGHRFAGNVYNLTGSLVGVAHRRRHARDSARATVVGPLLSASRRQDASRYDPNATSMSGWSGFRQPRQGSGRRTVRG